MTRRLRGRSADPDGDEVVDDGPSVEELQDAGVRRIHRRRRLVVAGGVVVAVLVIGLVASALLRDDDGPVGKPAAEPLPTEPAGDVLARYRESPCTLLAEAEILEATERAPKVNGGGPETLCTFDLAGKPAGDVITAQVIGPLDDDRWATFTAGSETVDRGGNVGDWLDGGGTGGRLLARRDLVAVEIGVRLADLDKGRLQEIASALLDHALARIPDNVAGGATGATTPSQGAEPSCELADSDDVAKVLGGEVTVTPSIAAAACSFRTGDTSATLEVITGSLPDLDDIVHATTSADGDVVTWERSEVDAGDEGLFLGNPDGDAGEGEVYVIDGDELVHVQVSGVEDPKAAATALAELVLA